MTFLFFAGVIVLVFGLASMNWLGIVLGVIALAWSVAKLDERIERDNRERMEAMRQENLARGNGRPKGNVDLVVKSDG